MKRPLFAVSVLLGVWLATAAAWAGGPTELQRKIYQRVDRAAGVIEALLDAPDAGIPRGLLDRAECVAIIPGMKKAGLGFGGRYGRGVVTCRRRDGLTDWGAPSMISLKGGSFGLQIGGASIDVVMLIFNRHGLERLMGDNFKLGADASVAAGPIGRATTAETNIRLDARILTYSRSKGLFAGIELKGAVVKPDREANYALYEAEWNPDEVLFTDHVTVPGNARWLIDILGRRSPTADAHAGRGADPSPPEAAGSRADRDGGDRDDGGYRDEGYRDEGYRDEGYRDDGGYRGEGYEGHRR